MSDSTETAIALTGNVYLEHPVSHYRMERFQPVVDFLRGCDATLTNMECAIEDGEDWPAYMAGTGWSATYMAGKPSMVDDLHYLGIDAVYAANNHVGDFGEAGILTTIKHLRNRNMPFAGIGASLTEATEACYFDTPNGRRVAVISALDWGPRGIMDMDFPWPWGQMPSDDGPPYRRRPGVSLLRYNAQTTVDEQTFKELRRASEYLGWDEAKAWRRAGASRDHALSGPYMIDWEQDTDDEFFFMGRKFVKGDGPGLSTSLVLEDADRIYKYIRDARRQADFVVVALHDQSHGNGVHQHIHTFAHGAIDAGADIYLNTGGLPRGIEIYNGKVIIYGQPGLFLQNDQVTHVPSSALPLMNLAPDATTSDFLDAREQGTAGGRRFDIGRGTVVNVVVFDEEGRVSELRIQPLDVSDGPRFRRGVPLWPAEDDDLASDTISRVATRSAEFGTKVEMVDGIGIVKVG
jgi:poly-gamma-glutamate capsule biosynthesis protein CapA/YwtB (metallophosphatase superfamily)